MEIEDSYKSAYISYANNSCNAVYILSLALNYMQDNNIEYREDDIVNHCVGDILYRPIQVEEGMRIICLEPKYKLLLLNRFGRYYWSRYERFKEFNIKF